MALLIADSSRYQLSYLAETVPGTTPAAAFTNLRNTGESITGAKETITSDEIENSRQTTDNVQVGRNVSGDINGRVSYGEYDVLMAAALQSNWTAAVECTGTLGYTYSAGSQTGTFTFGSAPAGLTTIVPGQTVRVVTNQAAINGFYRVVSVTSTSFTVNRRRGGSLPTATATGATATVSTSGMLRNGVTRKTFSIQKEFADVGTLGTSKFHVFRGCEVNSFSMSMETKQILAIVFGFLGRTAATADTPFGVGANIAQGTNQLMNSVNNVGSIQFDGVVYEGGLRSLNFQLENQLREQPMIGTLDQSVGNGQLQITGSMDAYFADNTLFQKFQDHADVEIAYFIGDDNTVGSGQLNGNAYMITFPRVKITESPINASGNNEDVIQQMNFEALKSKDGLAYTIQIDRFEA